MPTASTISTTPRTSRYTDQDTDEDDDGSPGVPHTGYGLYDARTEALKW
ncbi:hypothetical protein OG978_44290 (plasmid) [Streptomyces sp. NBC_01591]|nr:hypothetical protein [Streptomyces sp. NBC_01591]WSD74680.1 hypothetical protein OG978_44290 [Streptomyces sp. NBC_01591]